MSWILFWFEPASGLKINLDKSEVVLVGEVEEVNEMAVEIGCRVGQLPAVYLGRLIRPLPCGMGWKRRRGGDLPFGNANIFPKVGESLL